MKNHCQTCVFSIPQIDDKGRVTGLVDCPKKGYGNAAASDIHPCEHYRNDVRLAIGQNTAEDLTDAAYRR